MAKGILGNFCCALGLCEVRKFVKPGGGGGVGVDDSDGLDEDWRRKYVRIESVEQRKLYKKEFAANYQEYKTLHTYIQQVWSSSTILFCLCFYFPSWKGVK